MVKMWTSQIKIPVITKDTIEKGGRGRGWPYLTNNYDWEVCFKCHLD